MFEFLLPLGLGLFAYALVSARAERSIFSAPFLFTAGGLGLVAVAGSEHLVALEPLLEVAAELTLILVLFGDASRIPLGRLRAGASLPIRMLTVGMGLTVVLGTVAARILLGLPWVEAVLLAAILAPTDAALGQAVVSSSQVPPRIRQALNVESGLNDGVALPLVTILVALIAPHAGEGIDENRLTFIVSQLILGPTAGVVVGGGGGLLLRRACERGETTGAFERVATLCIAGLSYLIAHEVGGNGFIAAFVGGLAFGQIAPQTASGMHAFLEAEGSLLMLAVFCLFGCLLLPEVLGDLTVPVAAYAFVSLTIVRMVPVALALIGTGLSSASVLFLGWFGPRGLASILFALLVPRDASEGTELLVHVSFLTVAASIVAHGVTAVPWVNAYAARMASQPERLPSEHGEVEPLPGRSGHVRRGGRPETA